MFFSQQIFISFSSFFALREEGGAVAPLVSAILLEKDFHLGW
jgi:hypothetical protein